MQLRPLRRTDREPISQLLQRTDAFSDEEREVALELIDESIVHPDETGYHSLVARADGPENEAAMLGYVCYGPTPMTDHTYDLYWIAVDPASQGQGVGRRLLAALDEALAERGGQLIRVEASSSGDSPGTLAFYAGTGFTEAGRIPDFYRAGDDLVIFYRRAGTPLRPADA